MRIFLVCLISWFVAQLIKVIINLVKYYVAKKKGIKRKKVTLETLFKLGGMPSSHTATVIALCGCVGLHSGFTSDVFAACGVFAFITMFDAFKVRLPISRLTDAFNRLQDKVCGNDVPDVTEGSECVTDPREETYTCVCPGGKSGQCPGERLN